MKISASQVVMECLLEQGVDTVFGYPGGTILNIYDELELHGYGKKIRHILTAHEQGASHAADGYARSTGKVGVCFATSGPGATNLVTGIATAYMDSSPVVFITVNVGESLIGKDTFQEVDITGITLPITKCNYLVKDATKLADIIREAFAIARSGRPGPVLIDILKNVTSEEVDFTPLPLSEHHRHGRLAALLARNSDGLNMKIPEPDHGDVDKLVSMLDEAKKPLILVGGGVIRSKGAVPEFRDFIKQVGAPVATTVMGGGACPGDSDIITGMIGMHGSHASNYASSACDLLIAVGCRFSDRVTCDTSTFAKNAKVVHIDIDRAEIDKNIVTDHHIIGDARRVLELLNERIYLKDYDFSAWREEVLSIKEPPLVHNPEKLLPHEILHTISDLTRGEAIIATDVGQHQMWSCQYFHFKRPGQLLTSGGFGTMGFGLGAAIGAKRGNPDKTVIHITGDGCFRMNGNELATEEFYKLPVITFIFNNGNLGMVRQWQNLTCDKRFSETALNRGPDFVKYTQSFGLGARRASNPQELEDAITEALRENEQGRGFVIECSIDADEMVHPMVNGGHHITEFLLS